MNYVDGVEIRVWRSTTDSPDDILALMNETREIKLTREWLANKLSWGQGGIATVAYSNGSPVGVALLGFAPYLVAQQPTDILLSLYNYVSSDFRGRGIYARLLHRLNEVCTSLGFDLAFTYPNDLSRPGFINAGWKALPSMQAYIRVPWSWNARTMLKRLARLVRNRSEDFVVDRGDGIDDQDFEILAERSEPSSLLEFSQSAAALRYRLNAERGSGYSVVHDENASAVVRSGQRGSVSEVQFMATFPRHISPGAWRSLIRNVQDRFAPDLISHIESTDDTRRLAKVKSGLLRLRTITTPHWKSFQGRSLSNQPFLSGIDLHLW
jgi:GNAT superfamily N-acetyltransferase